MLNVYSHIYCYVSETTIWGSAFKVHVHSKEVHCKLQSNLVALKCFPSEHGISRPTTT